jgi:DNA-binding transcriptional ArsR family regulator
MQMQPLAKALRGALLDRAWMQWAALCVDATADMDDGVVDPEALIALTAELGDADARLRDLSTDWCVDFGRYVNGSRLKQVTREIGTPTDAIGEYVATVAAAGGPVWPLATSPRANHVRRHKARLASAAAPSRLRIRLRAAFGVNARADILAALLAASPAGLNAADLARATHFTKPSVAAALDALVLAGLVTAQPVGNERRFALPTKVAVLPGLRPPVPQADWVATFSVALEVLRFLSGDDMSPTVRAIEARRLVNSLTGRISTGRMPMPSMDADGEAFGPAFDRWVVRLVDWLRAPAGSKLTPGDR